jgi:hypothetical protein
VVDDVHHDVMEVEEVVDDGNVADEVEEVADDDNDSEVEEVADNKPEHH